MLELSNLKPNKGAKKKRKKVGRGTSSGHGKTAGRGHKGQKSRSGGTKGVRFEGGQTPLYRRLPKIGSFKNYPFKREYNILNVSDLNVFEEGTNVTKSLLHEKFFNATKKESLNPIKILGGGTLNKSLTVEADYFSKSAIKKIEAAKGKVISK